MKIKHIAFIMILIIAILLIMIPNTQADTHGGQGGKFGVEDDIGDDVLDWTFTAPEVPAKLTTIIGTIIAILRNISIIVTVIVITILGVKYMLGSVSEKADYKKDFPNIIIGVVLIAGVFSIVSMIFSVAEGIL